MSLKRYSPLLVTLLISACNTTNTVSRDLKVASGSKPLTVDNYYSINPDCTSRDLPSARVLAHPQHGKVEIRASKDFPTFQPDNSRYICNTRRVPVTQVVYVSSSGYAGPDNFKLDVVFPSGNSRTYQYQIEVR